MTSPQETRPPPRGCLVDLVTREMAADPSLEAVRIDRRSGALSVATLGKPSPSASVDRVAARIQAAGQGDGDVSCALLQGAEDCSNCPHSGDLPTDGRFHVEHAADATTIARVTCPTAPSLWRWWEKPLPKFVAREVRLPEDEHQENAWKAQLAAAAICGVGTAASLLLPGTAAWVATGVAFIAGAWFPLVEARERLRERHLDVHFLMLAVAAGAASIGAWTEGAVLLFLFSLSGALEHYALGRTHREIRSLIREAPKECVVLGQDHAEHRVPVASVECGMRLLVRPGQLFPVDAEITRGATAADESNLTGEAIPVEKQVGDTVLGGTLNLWGAVEATVLRPASGSALHRIIELIRESQSMKAPSQRFTDRFGTGYTLGILGLTVAMFLVWWLGLGRSPWISAGDQKSAFYLAMTLLVVASPCALVLSIPSAILAAIAHGARKGFLFRGGAAVEKLAEVDVVAMDKTGTLTTGELRVQSVTSYPPGRESEVLALAVSLERLSHHPLARAVTRHGKQAGIEPLAVDHLESVTGQGLLARIHGREVRLGRRHFVEPAIEVGLPLPTDPPDPGTSEIWIAGHGLAGRLLLRDEIRPQAREVVDQLRADRLHTLVLTGDRAATGEHLRRALDVDEVRAELKPEEKVAAIVQLTCAGRRVAMIGDGVNDAPALAVAHVGVAMGARGSDAALEQADVVLMHDRLENFRAAHRLSRRARTVIRQNLLISLGTLGVLAVLAISAKVPLTHGVVGHEGSTVLVVLNSLRLLFPERRESALPEARTP